MNVKRALDWMLWTPRNALLSLVGAMVGFMAVLMLFGGASGSSTAAEPTATASATGTSSPTSSATTAPVVPIPKVSVAPLPAAPTPSLPSVTPSIPGAQADDPATPEGVADKFMRTYLAVREEERAEWEADLIALSSGTNMEQMIRTVPPSMIPAARVMSAVKQSASERAATVTVPITNGDAYTVMLTLDPDGRWLVVSADPGGGDA